MGTMDEKRLREIPDEAAGRDAARRLGAEKWTPADAMAELDRGADRRAVAELASACAVAAGARSDYVTAHRWSDVMTAALGERADGSRAPRVHWVESAAFPNPWMAVDDIRFAIDPVRGCIPAREIFGQWVPADIGLDVPHGMLHSNTPAGLNPTLSYGRRSGKTAAAKNFTIIGKLSTQDMISIRRQLDESERDLAKRERTKVERESRPDWLTEARSHAPCWATVEPGDTRFSYPTVRVITATHCTTGRSDSWALQYAESVGWPEFFERVKLHWLATGVDEDTFHDARPKDAAGWRAVCPLCGVMAAHYRLAPWTRCRCQAVWRWESDNEIALRWDEIAPRSDAMRHVEPGRRWLGES